MAQLGGCRARRRRSLKKSGGIVVARVRAALIRRGRRCRSGAQTNLFARHGRPNYKEADDARALALTPARVCESA